MPKITYLDIDGARHDVEVAVGTTLMEGAIDNNVSGIVAECGGACACATCHGYIAEQWLPALPPMDDMEDAMLGSAEHRRPTSRLSCQIEVTEAMDGLEMQTANNEY